MSEKESVALPARHFKLEFWVGLFALLSVACAGWLSVSLGGTEFFGSSRQTILAEFDNISGLQLGASVEIAGVPVGQVTAINLKDPKALITLSIDNNIKLRDDDMLAIRTKGIIGDRYVKITRGGSEETLAPGSVIVDTESVVDIEDLIGKIIHTMTSDDDEDSGANGQGGTTEPAA